MTMNARSGRPLRTRAGGRATAAFVCRHEHPHRGAGALPGGFVTIDVTRPARFVAALKASPALAATAPVLSRSGGTGGPAERRSMNGQARPAVDQADSAFALPPGRFPLRALHKMDDAILGPRLTKPALPRRLRDTGRLEATGETGASFRPAKLRRHRAAV